MNEADLQIPPIPPRGDDEARPRWSVMIPARNAAATIAQTIDSVLAQAPDGGEMQVAVVDNASTDDTVRVVESVAAMHPRRTLEIHRHAADIGMAGNWNACLHLARGQWVHLLHADDYVQPGFYAAVDRAVASHEDAMLCLVRALVVDAGGAPERLARRQGSTGDELSVYTLAYGNEYYTPGVVVRRAAYERVGGFSPVLRFVPDWEMWVRILASGKAVYVNEPLACYREAAGNATNRLSRSADDLRELVGFGRLLAKRLAWFDEQLWREYLKGHAAWAVRNWSGAGDQAARAANYAYWRRWASAGERLDQRLVQLRALSKQVRWRLRRVLRPWKK